MKTRMQRSVIKKALLIALMLGTDSVWARWMLVSQTETTNIYIDSESIRVDGNIVRLWQLQDLKQRHKDGELSRRLRMEYDCKQERSRALSLSTHSEPMAGGNTLHISMEMDIWRDIPPSTSAATILKTLCAK